MGVPSYCASFSNEGMVERLDQPVRTKKVMRPELVHGDGSPFHLEKWVKVVRRLFDDVDLVGKKRVNGSDPNALPRAPSTGRGAERR